MRLTCFLAVFFSLTLIFSCKKKADSTEEESKPIASFSANKSSYSGGDTILLTNTSQFAESIKWTLPNGSTLSDQQISFVTKITEAEDLELLFKLEAFSKSGNKSDYFAKSVPVTAVTGEIMVYVAAYSGRQLPGIVRITLDGIQQVDFDFQGKGFNPYTSIPDCGTTGAYTFKKVKQGVHTIHTNVYNGTSTVNVLPNSCNKIET